MFGPIHNSLPTWLPRRLRFMPGTLPVDAGQTLLAALRRDERFIDHVAVVTRAGDWDGMGSLPMIVQAMPSGAEEVEIGQEYWTGEYVYVRPPYMAGMEQDVPMPYTQQGWEVARAARRYVGTPYSFLDYVAILGVHLGVKNGALRRYVRSTGHMICSQLADQAMADAGFHVFTDGRLPQDVMPVELYRALTRMPGVLVLRPGLDHAFTSPAGWVAEP